MTPGLWNESPAAELWKAMAGMVFWWGGDLDNDSWVRASPILGRATLAHMAVCGLETASFPLVGTAPRGGHSLPRGTLAHPTRNPAAVNNLHNHIQRPCLTGLWA